MYEEPLQFPPIQNGTLLSKCAYLLWQQWQFAKWLIMGISYLLYARLVQGASQALGVVLIVFDKLFQSGKGDFIRHKVSTDWRTMDTEMEDSGFTPGCETSNKICQMMYRWFLLGLFKIQQRTTVRMKALLQCMTSKILQLWFKISLYSRSL